MNDAGRFNSGRMSAGPSQAEDGATFDDVANLFTALEDQLGLKLEATRGPVSVVVIDAVHRPTPN